MMAHPPRPPPLLVLLALSLCLASAAAATPPPESEPVGPSGGDAAPPATGPVRLSLLSLSLAVALLAVPVAAARALGLKQEWRLLVAAVRCLAQLGTLGYLLVPIFRYDYLVVVLAYFVFPMSITAAWEGVGRPSYTYRYMWLDAWAAITLPVVAVLAYALLLIVSTVPWWQAQYLIPLAGMLLGNATSGVALGLSQATSGLAEGRDGVEALLARGATRWEACQPLVTRAVLTGITPTLNMMNIIGLVSIPGMMTGQILGGTPPEEAARYQIMIVFMLAASTTLSSTLAVVAAVWRVTDAQQRLRHERLIKRGKAAHAWRSLRTAVAGAWGATRAWAGRRCGGGRQRGGVGGAGGEYEGLTEGIAGRVDDNRLG